MARAAGSVNTIVVEDDGRLLGDSTDGAAITGALEAAGVGPGPALVLGAGGAARAAVAALAAWGAEVAVLARRPDAAAALASDLAVQTADGVPGRLPPIVVNATPLGGASAPDAPALPVELLDANTAVVDLAYRPDARPTPLVAAARAAGAPAVNGLRCWPARARSRSRAGRVATHRWRSCAARSCR